MASTQIPAFITYHKPGVQPPLYVAGTFSNPPWQPFEMDHTTREDGEYDFKKEVHGEPGSEIQYKFRINGGDWMLKDDGPTVTDSAGNTNHVLEVKPQTESSHEQTERPEGGASQGAAPSYAKVAAKRLQEPSAEQTSDRSGTGTPISARNAAEVADSAELLHEEVPEREGHEGGGASGSGARRESTRSMSDASETAAEVADTAERLDHAAERPDHDKTNQTNQNAILILEPPPGEGRPFKVQPRGGEFSFDQDEYIADKSPLFAHEAVGLYESDEEADQGYSEDDIAVDAEPVDDFDPDDIDPNDPRLERFPSTREDIMDAVRKLETGLQADQPSFDGHARSPVFNPSRRGTEDITGDFLLTAPQPASPPTHHRPSKKSPRGSVVSIPASASLHSISEAEEDEAEEEDSFRPAVVFSNPLKRKPKHLKIPTSDEDEGVALPDGVSPRTVKPPRPIVTPEASPGHSPPSPRTQRSGHSKLAPAEAELGKDKERSMQEVRLHPPQSANPGDAETPKAKDSTNPGGPSYAWVASPIHTEDASESQATPAQAPSDEGPTENNTAASQAPNNDGDENTTFEAPSARRPSYAAVAASQPTSAEGPSESKTTSNGPSAEESKPTAPQPQTTDNNKDTAPTFPTTARRRSYAEVAASKPKPLADDKAKAKPPQPPAAAESSTAKTSATGTDKDANKDKASQVRKRGGPSREEQVRSPDSGSRVPAVQPKRGGGWIKAILRFFFVDMMGGVLRRVLRMVGLGGRRGE